MSPKNAIINADIALLTLGTKKDLSLSAWQKIVSNISDSGLVNAINFAGGEPLLYSDFVPLFLFCHDCGFAHSIIST